MTTGVALMVTGVVLMVTATVDGDGAGEAGVDGDGEAKETALALTQTGLIQVTPR